jgi:hypothetical protein
LDYFLKSYSQVIADFFHSQAQVVNGGIDTLSQIKPVSEGGGPTFLGLVIQVFAASFKY